MVNFKIILILFFNFFCLILFPKPPEWWLKLNDDKQYEYFQEAIKQAEEAVKHGESLIKIIEDSNKKLEVIKKNLINEAQEKPKYLIDFNYNFLLDKKITFSHYFGFQFGFIVFKRFIISPSICLILGDNELKTGLGVSFSVIIF